MSATAEVKTEISNLSHKLINFMAIIGFVFFISNGIILPAAYAEEIDGGQLYNQYCAVCHKSGLNAAPKIGNKALWIKRVQQGKETVYSNAINGLRGMPPRGGYSQLSDEEVKAATDYMVGRSGGWGE